MHSFDFPWRVASDRGASFELLARDGAFARAAYRGPAEARPVVGDFVTIDALTGRIESIAPRTSWLTRAGKKDVPQFVAANLTAAFVVTSPEAREFSPARISRYVVALLGGNVELVVLLNKCDADANVDAHVAALRGVAAGAPVIPISARDGTACDALEPYLHPAATIALCGSSGVGKSTLLNRLAGHEMMSTKEMREDGRGRHTTSFRQLITLSNGAALIDTPGMRAFLPWAKSTAVENAFADVVSLAGGCRFSDCTHRTEPGCAVRDAAVPERLEQWRKLRREAEWVDSKSDALLAAQRKRSWKQIHKAARALSRRNPL